MISISSIHFCFVSSSFAMFLSISSIFYSEHKRQIASSVVYMLSISACNRSNSLLCCYNILFCVWSCSESPNFFIFLIPDYRAFIISCFIFILFLIRSYFVSSIFIPNCLTVLVTSLQNMIRLFPSLTYSYFMGTCFLVFLDFEVRCQRLRFLCGITFSFLRWWWVLRRSVSFWEKFS